MKREEQDINKKPVMVYYCECGRSIESAGDPKHFSRKTWNEYGRMEKAGRKVDTITLEEFHKIPFLCNGVAECTDPPKKKKYKSTGKPNEYIPGGFTTINKSTNATTR